MSDKKRIIKHVPQGRKLPESSKKSYLMVSVKQLIGQSTAGLLYFEIKNDGGARCVKRSVQLGTSIVIESDMIIRFRLDDDLAWEWSEYPFTLKQKGHARFYHVEPSKTDTREFDLHVTKNNAPNGASHACHFNVVMSQLFGSPIEISFDPDVKNPPPPPSMVPRDEKDLGFVPEGKSAPI